MYAYAYAQIAYNEAQNNNGFGFRMEGKKPQNNEFIKLFLLTSEMSGEKNTTSPNVYIQKGRWNDVNSKIWANKVCVCVLRYTIVLILPFAIFQL